MHLKRKPNYLESKDTRFDRTGFDIISCAIKNDFAGVDKALARDPECIRAQWSHNGINAIMAASGRGLQEMVTHLLAKEGVDLGQIDDFGRSALDHSKPFPQILTLLVAAKYPGRKWTEPAIFPV